MPKQNDETSQKISGLSVRTRMQIGLTCYAPSPENQACSYECPRIYGLKDPVGNARCLAECDRKFPERVQVPCSIELE